MKIRKRTLILTFVLFAICGSIVWLTLAFSGLLDSGRFEIVQSQAVSYGHIAMLARRSDTTAMSGDTYFVVIDSHLYSNKELKKAFYSTRPVVVAGRSGLTIQSRMANALTIECRSCGITKELIQKQRFSDNGIAIEYKGFP